MIEEITVDAYGDDEQIWAFRQAFEDNVDLPADGSAIGKDPDLVVKVKHHKPDDKPGNGIQCCNNGS